MDYVYQCVAITRWPWLYSLLDGVGTFSWTHVCANFVALRLFTNSKFLLFTFPVSQTATQTFFRAGTRATLQEETNPRATRQFTCGSCLRWPVSIWQWFLIQSSFVFGFPELRRLRRDLKRFQRSAYSCGTYSNLRTQVKAFFLSCFYFKLTPVPAELTTVCLYVQFLSRTLTPPSIRNYLSGVKLLHLFSGADYSFTKVSSVLTSGVDFSTHPPVCY